MFVLSRDGRLIYLNPEERKLKYWASQPNIESGDFTCISTSVYGHIAVLDSLRYRIYVFHPNKGKWIIIDRNLESLQQLVTFNPTNICFGTGTEIYAAEYGNDRIVKVDVDGNFIGVISSAESLIRIQRPRAICSLFDGRIIVLSLRGPRIYVLGGDSKVETDFDLPPIGTEFSTHACLARGPDNFFAIGDKGRWKVHIYRTDGTLIHQLNVRSPFGMAFSDDYFWVTEEERNRISIW